MEIGEALRNARLEQKISLDKIENDTKIRKRYLEAMENEEWSVFPGKVYLRGFLKTYSAYLGLNEKEILDTFANNLVEENKTQPLPEKIEMPGRPRRKLSIIVGIIAVLLLAASQHFYQNFISDPHTDQDSVPQITDKQETGDLENENPAVVAEEGDAENPEETPRDNGDLATQEIDDFSLQIKGVQDRCWVQVNDGEKVIYEGTLTEGQEQTFTGLTKVTLRLGNAGNVKMFLNDKDLGAPGEVGEVLTKKYELENNEIKEI